jgi:serine/threonine-protein kinase RsbW
MPIDSGQNGGFRELLNLDIRADGEAVANASDRIAEELVRLEVPEQKRLEIGLAVQEALANAVVHGCNNDSSKQVQCRLSCDLEGRILVVVTDPGAGFASAGTRDPKTGANVYADHGRGVYLIRQLMDEVRFEGRGNEIKMWKY